MDIIAHLCCFQSFVTKSIVVIISLTHISLHMCGVNFYGFHQIALKEVLPPHILPPQELVTISLHHVVCVLSWLDFTEHSVLRLVHAAPCVAHPALAPPCVPSLSHALPPYTGLEALVFLRNSRKGHLSSPKLLLCWETTSCHHFENFTEPGANWTRPVRPAGVQGCKSLR